MGFSTVAAQAIFFIAVIGVSASLISVFSSYVDEASNAMSDKQQYITSQLRTDIVITTVDNSSGNLYVFVKNVGNEQLDTECVELFVDSGYANLDADDILDPATASQVTEWDPEDTIELRPDAAPLNSGSIHEAKVITCNGVTDTEDFSS